MVRQIKRTLPEAFHSQLPTFECREAAGVLQGCKPHLDLKSFLALLLLCCTNKRQKLATGNRNLNRKQQSRLSVDKLGKQRGLC